MVKDQKKVAIAILLRGDLAEHGQDRAACILFIGKRLQAALSLTHIHQGADLLQGRIFGMHMHVGWRDASGVLQTRSSQHYEILMHCKRFRTCTHLGKDYELERIREASLAQQERRIFCRDWCMPGIFCNTCYPLLVLW